MATEESRVVLVTGANKGIGKEIARGLAQQGLTVLLGARDDTRGEAAAAELQGDGKVVFLKLDVTDDKSVQAAVRRVEAEFSRLDILINNSGIAVLTKPEGPATLQAMRETFDVNLFGVVRVTDAFLPLLKNAPHASIVNVSSGMGSISRPMRLWEAMPYSVSKSALNALTVHWASELGEANIKVNAVCPGYCGTDLNQHKGPRSTTQGAVQPIRMALIGPDGPTGTYSNEDEPIPW